MKRLLIFKHVIVKVLQVNTVVNSGSTGRIAEDIGHILLEEGHESYIAFGRGDRPSKSELIRIGRQQDLISHGLKSLLLDRHGFGSAKATRDFVRKLEKIDPDVIALYNLHGYYLNLKELFGYLAESKKPIVWTLFDCWSFTGHCTYFDDIQCGKWKTACHQCPKTRKYPKSIGLDNSRRNFLEKKDLYARSPNLSLVVHSKWLKGLVSQSFLRELPIHCVPTGADTEIFKPTAEEKKLEIGGAESRHIVLGVASTWDLRKGLQDFVELSKRLPPDYQIVLVGLNQRQISALPANIVGIQRTENLQELVALYSQASVFVNPTYQDNFPTTNIEALACGTPVVTYNTGGSPEAVDEKTGKVVEKGNLEQLVTAIMEVCTSDRLALREKCRQKALLDFDKTKQYKKYLAIFEDKLLRSRAGSRKFK